MNPYKSLPPEAFWKLAVAERAVFDIERLYTKKFEITATDRIATMGSCFAQHIGRRLKAAEYAYVDLEPAPLLLPKEKHADFGYGVYSARYGNIYTARQLLQLFDRAFDNFAPVDDVWETDGRFYDAFRPTMEPNGFGSVDELKALHRRTMAATRRIFKKASVLVFTLGLTEAWVSKADGAVYPTSPGTTAGVFDPDRYEFQNFTFNEIMRDLKTLMAKTRKINPSIRWLLTVSPVPLTATASGKHVLSATTYSKSVLRAVAGELEAEDPAVDYFPSYEIITGQPTRSIFYEPNLRSVHPTGVDTVMSHFFAEHANFAAIPDTVPEKPDDDVVCDEGRLEIWAAQ